MGRLPHGGGAFSGKDPTKVDRSAAYAARYLAKNVVAADLADRCTIQLSYAIGVARPLSIYANLHETGRVDEAKLETALTDVMNLSPRGIREHLSLNRPIFARTSSYGHFGRAPEVDGGFSCGKDRSRGYAAQYRLIGSPSRGSHDRCRRTRGARANPRPLRAQPRQSASNGPEAFARRSAAAVFNYARGLGRGGARSPPRRPKCGSRLGLAQANILWSRRKPTRTLGLLAVSRFLTGLSLRSQG